MTMGRSPTVNGAAIFHHALKAGLFAELTDRAFKVLSAVLFDVHNDGWSRGEPVSRTSRDNLAMELGVDVKTVQRGLQDLEDAGLVVRLHNDFHHAVGVDLTPLVDSFQQILERSKAERQRRQEARAERKRQRLARRLERAADTGEKNFADDDVSGPLDTPARLYTNNPCEELSIGCTGTGNAAVARRETDHPSGPPCPSDVVDIEAQAAETLPELKTWRSVVYRIHPEFRDIVADNTDHRDPDRATVDELWNAADALRERIGFRWKDLELARRRHGTARTLIFFVSMTAPAAEHHRKIRNVQGYIVGGLAKAPIDFCPIKSMWGLYKECRERSKLPADQRAAMEQRLAKLNAAAEQTDGLR